MFHYILILQYHWISPFLSASALSYPAHTSFVTCPILTPPHQVGTVVTQQNLNSNQLVSWIWQGGWVYWPYMKGSGVPPTPPPKMKSTCLIHPLPGSGSYSGTNGALLWPRLEHWPLRKVLPASYLYKALLPFGLVPVGTELWYMHLEA